MKKHTSNPKVASISRIAALAGLDRRTVSEQLRASRLRGQRKGTSLLFDVDAALVVLEAGRGLKSELLRERIRGLRRENDSAEGRLIPRVKIEDALARIAARVRECLETKLVNVYPGLVAGLDAPKARALGRKLNDEILAAFEALGSEFGTL